MAKDSMPSIARALMEPSKKGGPAKGKVSDELEDEEEYESEPDIEVSDTAVTAARAVRSAIKSGNDEELAKALKGFLQCESEA
jgi:hypothetical protein